MGVYLCSKFISLDYSKQTCWFTIRVLLFITYLFSLSFFPRVPTVKASLSLSRRSRTTRYNRRAGEPSVRRLLLALEQITEPLSRSCDDLRNVAAILSLISSLLLLVQDGDSRDLTATCSSMLNIPGRGLPIFVNGESKFSLFFTRTPSSPSSERRPSSFCCKLINFDIFFDIFTELY